MARAVADTASPLHGIEPSAVLVNDGRMCQRDQPDIGETLAVLIRRQSVPSVEALGTWNPVGFDTGYALMTFGAQFAEFAVDPDLGLVRVRRMVGGAFAPGCVLNAKMASSQLMGGMLWGLGQALHEGTLMDARAGRWANASLGEYLVPVNADAPAVEVELVHVDDTAVNPLGVNDAISGGRTAARQSRTRTHRQARIDARGSRRE